MLDCLVDACSALPRGYEVSIEEANDPQNLRMVEDWDEIYHADFKTSNGWYFFHNGKNTRLT
jgi:hypothetical protein